jgi:prepilin signal peptidase PulO-like enzyme (type II secretory pathway)
MDIVIALIAGIAGLLVGGILNVLADDLPTHQRPRAPHYPDGTPRPLAAWLGIAAFLSGMQVSPKDASARLSGGTQLQDVTALGFVGLALGYADEPNVPIWFVYLAIMILITVIDVEHRLILFVVIIPSCLLALLVAAVSPEEGKSFTEYVIGGAGGFLVFFLMFWWLPLRLFRVTKRSHSVLAT